MGWLKLTVALWLIRKAAKITGWLLVGAAVVAAWPLTSVAVAGYVAAQLFAAFDLQILWNKPGRQVTVFAEITEATLQVLPALLDPPGTETVTLPTSPQAK